MNPVRASGAVPSAVALALAASLAGAPQLLQAGDDHGRHRCSCPAGAHICTCARCLAAARGERHGTAKGRSCCRGGIAAPARPASDHQRPPPGMLCMSASCGGFPVVATLAAGAEPFVVPQHFLAPPAGRGEAFATVAIGPGGDRAAPRLPPPRA